MTITASDSSAVLIISTNGAKGAKGDAGANGFGLNLIRYDLLSAATSNYYARNDLVKLSQCFLTTTRTTSGAYTDIYGNPQTLGDDWPREELKGWLINGDEVHTFHNYNNVAQINDGYSMSVRIGAYSETSPSQKLITIPGAVGETLSLGTDASGNWVVNIQGDNNITYQAASTTSATATSDRYIAITFDTGVLNLYLDGVIAGTVTIPTGNCIGISTTQDSTISGDFSVNILDLRQYGFALNDSEITFLS